MQGGDLAGALASDAAGELSWGRRGKDIALGIAEGLAYLHANNVTHRQAAGRLQSSDELQLTATALCSVVYACQPQMHRRPGVSAAERGCCACPL